MRSVLPLLSTLLLTACVADVGEGKVKAQVADVPAEQAAQTAAEATATTHKVDAAQSALQAVGAKITATHPIVFHTFEGAVQADGDTVQGVSFTAQMASLEADHPKLTAHLKDKDFFWVEQYPTSTFQSVSVTPGSDAGGTWTHTVTGDLTIRGKTKRLTFPAVITAAPDAFTANTEFVIDRKDFEVVYPGRPDDLVQDNVRMEIRFVAPRS